MGSGRGPSTSTKKLHIWVKRTMVPALYAIASAPFAPTLGMGWMVQEAQFGGLSAGWRGGGGGHNSAAAMWERH
jgi:hypothetical protein